MNDKPRIGDPVANPSDILSLTLRYAVIAIGIIASAAITVSTTYWIARAWESWSVQKKSLLLTTESSQNLAATPKGLAPGLEFNLVLSPNNKRTIESFFSYEVAVHNESTEPVENLTLHLYPPPNVTLIDPPRITTDSKILTEFVAQHKRVLEKAIVFDLDLLGAGQRVGIAYSGYSAEAIIDPGFIDVETRKKGWVVRKVEPGYSSWFDPVTGQVTTSRPGYTDYRTDFEPYERGQLNVLSKRITAYNGGDVISLLLLLVMVTCVFSLFAWLLVRILSGSLKSFHDWRSLVERLFRRAG